MNVISEMHEWPGLLKPMFFSLYLDESRTYKLEEEEEDEVEEIEDLKEKQRKRKEELIKRTRTSSKDGTDKPTATEGDKETRTTKP